MGTGCGGGAGSAVNQGWPLQRVDRAECAGAARRDHRRAALVVAPAVNYVEAHGTGTVLGDPIEFEALAATYGRGDVPCAAVKTNLGHLEAAAGVAGLIKAVLVLERGQIPPNLNFSRWNPADASSTRLVVPTDITPWPQCRVRGGGGVVVRHQRHERARGRPGSGGC